MKSNKQDLNELLIAVAVTSAKDHILWEINNKQDTWDTPESKQEYASIQAEKKTATDAYIAAGGLVTNRSVTGFHGGNLSHYDIDGAISKKFGKKVSPDSESGGFYAYTDASVINELVAFLKKNFPGLEFSVNEDNNSPNPMEISNWNSAERILENAGVTVDYAPEINIPLKSAEEIGKLLDEATHSLRMTGLVTEEEIEIMFDKYREVV